MGPEVITFIHDVVNYRPQNASVIVMPKGIGNKEQLLKAYYEKLELPEYFGFNWDALFDCLRDLHWLKTKLIVIVHHDLPEIENDELRIYIQLIADAISMWKPSDDHQLEVVFPEKFRNHIVEKFN